MKWVVQKEESGLKLLKFLKLKMDVHSLKQLKRFLEENACTVNQVTERFATRIVHKGDTVFFKNMEVVSKTSTPSNEILKTHILYEDEALLIYNKPSGITSDSFDTDLFLVHRLDKETTGVLCFAKTLKVLEEMIKLFRKHEVYKTYLAIVEGSPKKQKGIIDNYLGKKHDLHGQSIWGSVPKDKGLHAVTEWEIEKLGKNFSLLRCYPKTGRTHQIRVHLSEMKHPILGDYHYWRNFECEYKPNRCLLHAFKLIFIHPTKKTKLEIKAPMPSDFTLALKEML